MDVVDGKYKRKKMRYKEFNRSCTDYGRLRELGVPVLDPNEFNHFGQDDFDKLDPSDKHLFEVG